MAHRRELLVVILATSAVLTIKALTDRLDRDPDTINAVCANMTGVDAAVLEQARSGVFAPDDAKLKQHALCFSKKIGFQNEIGHVYLNVVQKRLDDALHNLTVVDRIIYDCVWLRDTPEETAFDMLTCMHKELPPGTIYVR